MLLLCISIRGRSVLTTRCPTGNNARHFIDADSRLDKLLPACRIKEALEGFTGVAIVPILNTGPVHFSEISQIPGVDAEQYDLTFVNCSVLL